MTNKTFVSNNAFGRCRQWCCSTFRRRMNLVAFGRVEHGVEQLIALSDDRLNGVTPKSDKTNINDSIRRRVRKLPMRRETNNHPERPESRRLCIRFVRFVRSFVVFVHNDIESSTHIRLPASTPSLNRTPFYRQTRLTFQNIILPLSLLAPIPTIVSTQCTRLRRFRSECGMLEC
jgi:hypothetical protein